MDLFLNRKSFVVKSLAITVTALMMSGANAATSEKRKFKNFVKKLKL